MVQRPSSAMLMMLMMAFAITKNGAVEAFR